MSLYKPVFYIEDENLMKIKKHINDKVYYSSFLIYDEQLLYCSYKKIQIHVVIHVYEYEIRDNDKIVLLYTRNMSSYSIFVFPQK